MNEAAGSRTIRVLVADDQRVTREGLTLLLSLMDGIEVVGIARDGAEAVAIATALHPDVVLMDLRMPGVDGVTATEQLRDRLPTVRVVVLTTYATEDAIVPALQAGARGYVTKDASAEEIELAVRAVHAGLTHLDPAVQERLVRIVASGPARAPGRQPGPPPDGLTAREVEVLSLIAQGLSNTDIASRLVVSAATVKSHVNRIFAKTGVRDRAQAVRYAYHHALVRPDDGDSGPRQP